MYSINGECSGFFQESFTCGIPARTTAVVEKIVAMYGPETIHATIDTTTRNETFVSKLVQLKVLDLRMHPIVSIHPLTYANGNW